MIRNRRTVNINVNENNEIIAYATVGGVGGIDVHFDILPEDFEEKYDRTYYLYEDGTIKVNPNYVKTKYDEEEQ